MEKKEQHRKLELGSGERPTPGYLHQDITPQDGVDLDFTCQPWELPIAVGSLSEVIGLGLMEHLRFKEFHATLRKIHQLLEDDGVFLFDVPDMKVWSEYLYNLPHGKQDENPFTPEHIWSTTYGWQRWPGDEHKSGWTRDSLLEAIKAAGFERFEEGVEIFTSKGIHRRRFTRPHDAHLYFKLIK
jgi:predicted SAM-dependent methyltransferase